ncbi:hypothetical protein HYW40_00635 [Candidatus Curtissbacteria bacterium]|nr:hypothetical protein [Candidatus Curtissbacteria bacterium]
MFNAHAFEIGGPKGVFQPAKLFADFGSLVTTVITLLTTVAGVVAIIFIIIGGIKIVTASGDMKKIQAAQGTILYAIIGLAVTILAFVILQIVQYFFGANVAIT